LDLDGSERQQRFKTGFDPKPYPPIIGCISGFLPQMDWRVWGQAFGRNGFGPTFQAFPINLQWQMNIPGMTKTAPTGGIDQ
jgi:hypothetical protein